MGSTYSWTAASRTAAILSVPAPLGVLLWLRPQPGYSTSRLVPFGLIGGAAVGGGVGVIVDRTAVTLVGVAALFLHGFWQAVLGVSVWPVVGLLLFASLNDRIASSGETVGGAPTADPSRPTARSRPDSHRARRRVRDDGRRLPSGRYRLGPERHP